MASIKYDRETRKATIQFRDSSRRRRTIRLSNVSKTFAERYQSTVDRLNDAKRTGGGVDRHVASFVNELGDVFYDKLVKVELVEPRTDSAAAESSDSNGKRALAVDQLVDDFLNARVDIQKSTATCYRQIQTNLTEFFKGRDIREITAGDAADFARWLDGNQGLADCTVYRRVTRCRTVFDWAVDHTWLERNPFAKVKAGSRTNSDRQRYVKAAEIQRVIAACPDAEWRAMICLARFCGLRCPSEILSLRWDDIDWSEDALTIDSPKTGLRRCPLFVDAKSALNDLWDELDTGSSEFVIARHRPNELRNAAGNWQSVNLRTTFKKIIRRSGVKEWPKLWNNLRASCATDLAGQFPSHVAATWLGHSERIADAHYRQVTEDDWQRARVMPQMMPSGPVSPCTVSQSESGGCSNAPAKQGKTGRCDSVRNAKMAPAGLEPALERF